MTVRAIGVQGESARSKIRFAGGGEGGGAVAYAGIPGTIAGPLPATQADMMSGVPTRYVASPSSAWTTGQFVQTATAGAAGRVTWTGTAWVGGVAP